MSAWVELPQGQQAAIRKGNFYAAVASLKANHAQADVLKIAASRGLSVFDYAEQGQREGLGPDPNSPGYRYVALQAQATADGTLPWSAPVPLSWIDSSHLVRVWEAAPGAIAPTPAAPPAASSFPTMAILLGSAAAGAVIWWIWKSAPA